MQVFIALFLGMSAFSLASVSNDLQADMSLVRNIDPASLAAEVPKMINSLLDHEHTAQQSSAKSTGTITVVDADPTQYTLSLSTVGPDVVLTTTTITPMGNKASSTSTSSATGSGIASPVIPWAPHPHLEVITQTGFNGSVYTITRVDEGTATKTVSEVTINGTTFMVSGMPTTATEAPLSTATDMITVVSTVTPSPGPSVPTTTDIVTVVPTVTPLPGPSVPTVAPTTIIQQVTVTEPAAPAITANPFDGYSMYQCQNDAVVEYDVPTGDFGKFEALGAPMGLNLARIGNFSQRNSFDAYPHDPSHFVPNETELDDLKARCANENLPYQTSYNTLWSALMPGGYEDYDRTRTVTASTVLINGALKNIGGMLYAVPETQTETEEWDSTRTVTMVTDHSTLYTISSSKGTYGTEQYELSASKREITETVSVVQLPHTTFTKQGYLGQEGGFFHKHDGQVEAYVDQPKCEKVLEVVDLGMCGGKRHLMQLNTLTHAPVARAPVCRSVHIPIGKKRKACASEWCMYQHQKPMMITTVQSAYVQKGNGPESHWANITQHYWETLPHWGTTNDKKIYWPFSITSTTHKKKHHGSYQSFAALDSDYSSRTRNSLVARAPSCWDRQSCSTMCDRLVHHPSSWLHGFNLFWLLTAILALLLLPCLCCFCCLPFFRRRRQARQKQQGGAVGTAESGQGHLGEVVVVTSGGGGQGGQGGGHGGPGETVVTTSTGNGGKVVEKVSGPAEVVTTGGGPQGGGQTVTTSGGGAGGQQGGGSTVVTSGGGAGGQQGGGSTVVTEEKPPGWKEKLTRRKTEKVK